MAGQEMPTKDKTYIEVDTFGRWRISDAKQYFERLRDEQVVTLGQHIGKRNSKRHREA